MIAPPGPDLSKSVNIESRISPEYFRDFMDHKSPEDVELLPRKYRPMYIYISDMEEFFNRLKTKLLTMGVKESECKCQLGSIR